MLYYKFFIRTIILIAHIYFVIGLERCHLIFKMISEWTTALRVSLRSLRKFLQHISIHWDEKRYLILKSNLEFPTTWITPVLFRMACPIAGWKRSICLSTSATLGSSRSTKRKAVMFTLLYLKSSKSNVSISCKNKCTTKFVYVKSNLYSQLTVIHLKIYCVHNIFLK